MVSHGKAFVSHLLKIIFRADASLQIGTGHVMRCLTLAERFKDDGAQVFFVCRDLPGNMVGFIKNKGFLVVTLQAPNRSSGFICAEDNVVHAEWLGVSWQQDAEETRLVLESQSETIDWLIVDHYSLDHRWEKNMRSLVQHIMVIDDLADRLHDCDLLLDQNLVADMELRYSSLIPERCRCLLGPHYSLLRPEFLALRDTALLRRNKIDKVEHLLVTMGGIDPDNVTSVVLDGIEKASFGGSVDVVMGQNSPHLKEVLRKAESSSTTVEVHVATREMARLMASANLAIGAGGSTSWERCALGLPSLVITTARNQEPIAAGLANSGAAQWLGKYEQVDSSSIATVLNQVSSDINWLKDMGEVASCVCDGKGLVRVAGEFVK
ncbi:MAG: UDP-2,4-diacetamido-2,4,6-trideoxy-beta-L-altropyranose hydrolase [Candidatus Electrothrix sp. AW2]|nr:UDP-2,4-diacetamido-2,4,6-trideoxy-beta-L-altropyranose hydrolase [Candidatus Electrothrix gigas]